MRVVCLPAVLGSKSTVPTVIVPSASVSLVVTLTVTGVSSLVVPVLFTATGAVEILIPKFAFTTLFVVKPGTKIIPSTLPSFPVNEFAKLFKISP